MIVIHYLNTIVIFLEYCCFLSLVQERHVLMHELLK